MKFTELTKSEFREFVNNNETNNFFQSVPMMERLEEEGKEVYLVGWAVCACRLFPKGQ